VRHHRGCAAERYGCGTAFQDRASGHCHRYLFAKQGAALRMATSLRRYPRAAPRRLGPHDNLRGAEYFEQDPRRPFMLQQPLLEKLTAMRLLGMVEALQAQQNDPAARELTFLERLGLMIDHQWN